MATPLLLPAKKIESFAKRTDFSNHYSVQRLRDILKKMGILRQLQREGINPDDKIIIGQPSIGGITY